MLLLPPLLWIEAADGTPSPSAHSRVERIVVGTVESLRGASRFYELRRGEEARPLRIADQVLAGDRIIVWREDGLVRVRLNTGELRIIERRHSNQPFEMSGAQASVVSNLLAGLARLVTPWHDFIELNLSVRAAPASALASLEMPLIPQQGATIAAGRRRFALSWLGGAPPFRVALIGVGDGSIVIEAGGLPRHELQAREIEFQTGHYEFRLSDANGRQVVRSLEVVPAARVPQPPAEPGTVHLFGDWLAAATAGWLAEQQDDRWLLEAFLQASSLQETFAPAQLLAGLLAAGGPGALP
jgi:hypothetical protein